MHEVMRAGGPTRLRCALVPVFGFKHFRLIDQRPMITQHTLIRRVRYRHSQFKTRKRSAVEVSSEVVVVGTRDAIDGNERQLRSKRVRHRQTYVDR